MKRFFGFILIISLISTLFMGCSNESNAVNDNKEGDSNSKKIKIVATIFPEYDFIKNIIKGKEDSYDLKILMDSGIDLHNFQPSAKDILDVGSSDLFVYVGGESDKWAESALKKATNENLKVLNLMELLKDKVKVEELVEGMQEEDEHDREEDHDEEQEDGHEEEHDEVEYDEHVWLSLKNAEIICKALENEIVNLDKENENIYRSNSNEYIKQLKSLDGEYKKAVDSSKNKLMLFGDRFPFRYMFDDYNIQYYAAFLGCSAETEASFETIKFLSDKLTSLKLNYVMKIERSEEKIARAIIENSEMKDAKIETMYSIQAVSKEDIEKGNTYLSYMKQNLDVLKKVLN